ncbi:hypothetical protein KM043_008436 [Ampulex compressa]|nr:hypothetical protein KM043_008436 [Ampulex compressa]
MGDALTNERCGGERDGVCLEIKGKVRLKDVKYIETPMYQSPTKDLQAEQIEIHELPSRYFRNERLCGKASRGGPQSKC